MKAAAAIIGAGKTGRGFLARLVQASHWSLRFVDSDSSLMERLQGLGKYAISFFGGERENVAISDYQAFPAGSIAATSTIAEVDLIFVSVGSRNFLDVARQVSRSAVMRKKSRKESRCFVLTCENALNAAATLRSAALETSPGDVRPFLEEWYRFVECAVFCSTIEKGDSGLDILSEDFEDLPYDADALNGETLPIKGLVPQSDFGIFLKRKLYTYNCASAAIAYLGARKGYRLYGEAANDPEILDLLRKLYDEIEQALCAEFAIDPLDQRQFAERSLKKFRNPSIVDTIARNARDVLRKLSPEDRLVGPANLMLRHGIEPDALASVFAAALRYDAPAESGLKRMLQEKGPEGVLSEVSGIDPKSGFGQRILKRFREAI
jgi:mannitol-1-phosphate 5-dehydrogenase